jgi:uncharacterized membrane protein
VLASALLVTYFVVLMPIPDKYVTIYLLDSHKKADDFPEVLATNQNSTFSVYVDVENHMGRPLNNTEVRVKVTSNPVPNFPVDENATQTLTSTVQDGDTWESIATVSLDQPGNYLVVFELWTPNEKTDVLQYSGFFASLNVQVVTQ